MYVLEWMIVAVLLFESITQVTQEPLQTYVEKRSKFLQAEATQRTGGKIKLNAKELKVNKILMDVKNNEFTAALSGDQFAPAMHFFKSKQLIEKSQVYKLIKKMPKGGALHIHFGSISTINWVIKNITYMSDLYYCNSSDGTGSLRFKFFSEPPTVTKPSCSMWQSVSAARASSGKTNFDKWLFTKMSMWTDEDPWKVYPNSTAAWNKFQPCFSPVADLVKYVNVYEMYLWQSLSEFMEDNVQYMEIRGVHQQLISPYGILLPFEYLMQLFARTVDRFVATYPDNFSGAKFILSSQRNTLQTTIMEDINIALKLRDTFPNHFAGYDLVGDEDTGHPLLYYINELLVPSQTNRSLPYFFHAGETDWEGTAIDDNLIDALLLNTSRIGHGYAITKHPVAMEMAKSKGVALEINPISNQVLHLVEDLRNHPAATLVSQGFPIVISSDDFSIWCSDPLSFDFYEFFMGLAGAKADLATLKQLAQDSIRYSVMTMDDKQKALALWDKKWQAFLDGVLMD